MNADLTPSPLAGRFCTYLHRRLDTNEVFYVGKGTLRRARAKWARGEHWSRIVKKHGRSVEIVAHWPTEAEAFEHERFLIWCFRDMGTALINKTDGGDGAPGAKPSEQTIEKMRTAHMRLRTVDPGLVGRRIEAMRMIKQTEEQRRLTSERMKMERNTEAARQRQSQDSLAAWGDPARRERRIASMRLAAPQSRPVVCIETGSTFASCAEAARALGLHISCVRAACNGKQKTAGGLRFSFVIKEPSCSS